MAPTRLCGRGLYRPVAARRKPLQRIRPRKLQRRQASPGPPPSNARNRVSGARGRRVLENGTGQRASANRIICCYDRIGAADFQASATEYRPRASRPIGLDELIQAAERVERGQPLPPESDAALLHGTSVGGARPKALIDGGQAHYIAKFSSTSDTYAVVKAVIMRPSGTGAICI